MQSIHEGAQTKVAKITSNMNFAQRRAVEANELRPEVHKMMQDATDVVYVINIRPLTYSRILTAFCNLCIEVWSFSNEI